MALTDAFENETARPIYWPVWTSETQLYPLGHEAGFGGKKLIGVERTAQGWFPIFE